MKSNRIGIYEVVQIVKQNAVYQWAVGRKPGERELVILQILHLSVSADVLRSLTDYFQKLQSISRSALLTPIQLFSTPEYPLVAVYPFRQTQPLAFALTPGDGENLTLWEQACDALHALHNQGLCHGNISFDSFILEEGTVLLTGFGYAPLLDYREKMALATTYSHLAPEVRQGNPTTQKADIYSFAVTLGEGIPTLKQSEFYLKATHLDPQQRPDRIRNLFNHFLNVMKQKDREIKVDSEHILIPVENTDDESILVPYQEGIILPAGYNHIKTVMLESCSFEVVKVNTTGQIIKREQKQAQYFTEDLGNGVTLEMVAIPAGTFMMGSPDNEAERLDNEGPQHRVTLSAFFMGRFQVTQAQWQAIMGNNPSSFKGKKRPVENVSWNDAQDFCKRLSQKTGPNYRLPSEAEWEYACRAGTTTPFYFGPTITTDLANYNGTSNYGSGPKGQNRQQTTEVGSFPPNIFGLYDMHGNVWEWCEDVYHESYIGAPAKGRAWVGGYSSCRLLRGGFWGYAPGGCRSANRDRYVVDMRIDFYGFRVVCSAPELL